MRVWLPKAVEHVRVWVQPQQEALHDDHEPRVGVDALHDDQLPYCQEYVTAQLPATVEKFPASGFGPFTAVEHEKPARVAVTLAQLVPCGIPVRMKDPVEEAATLVPQTETVAPLAFGPKVPETE